MMNKGIVISFEDIETKQEALVLVRHDEFCVVLGISHRGNGDLQVVMNKEPARQLMEALTTALQ